MNLGDYVPGIWAAYRRAISDAFAFFADRISLRESVPDHISEQPFAELMGWALSCPTLHKLGQVLARDRRLPQELRTALQVLECYAPRTSMQEVSTVIRGEFGEAAKGIHLGESGLAEASVAVVVPFRGPEGEAGVMKVLKPRAEARLHEELAVWIELGAYFNERCHAYGIPEVDYRETFDAVAELLRHEVDFAGEQRHLAWAWNALQTVPGVRVPRLLSPCSSRVTSMERIEGVKIADAPISSAFDRRDLAARLVEALLGHPLWSREQVAWFHADPHAGNLMFASDGSLVILDWALVGVITREERERLVQVVLGALLSDPPKMCMGIESLCQGRALSVERLGEVVREHLARMGTKWMPGVPWLAGLLDAAAMECGARFSSGMLMFRKALLMVEGVVSDLAGEGVLDGLVMDSTFRQLGREWPERLLMGPESREVGSRLSNAELLQATWTWPWSYGRRVFERIIRP